MSKVNMS